MNVDLNIFKNAKHMVEGYLYQKSKSLRNLVQYYQELPEMTPFKGAKTVENNQEFKQYEQFQKRISELNEQLITKFNAQDKYAQCDIFLDGLILKEQIHMKQFLQNELKHTTEDINRRFIQLLIDQYTKEPCQGKQFLERYFIMCKKNTIWEHMNDTLNELINKYTYKIELTKYPFRLLENDSKSNYILKLLRHSNCQLAGFNKVTILENQLPSFEDKTLRIQINCNSLDDVVFDETYNQNICPLTLLSWDIEVCTESGKFDNDGKNKENKVLCIGMSYGMLQKTNNSQYQLNTCITWVDSSDNQLSIGQFRQLYCQLKQQGNEFNQERQYVIRVNNEMEMIQGFFELVNLFDSSFITGFNDFQFDYPFIKDKISTFNHLEGNFKIIQLLYRGFMSQQNGKSFMGNLFSSQNIKISASDQKSGISLDVMGIISIDTRILLMKTQKLEKKSLNDYLIANKLPIKLDVSFKEMNRAFKRITQDNDEFRIENDKKQQITIQESKDILRDVFKYCMYDSQACYLLWTKRNILQQAIEVSKLSFTPLKYSFLNADGIKVRNMVAKFAYDNKFSVPMTIQSQDIRIRDIKLLQKYEKYPGAYVSPPKKGISVTPVSALDFESLYPSIIMAHNLSPEKVIEPQEIIDYSTKVTKIQIPFQKDDQSEVLQGNVLTRDNEVGVYPSILKFLFDSRKKVKQTIEKLNEKIDHLSQKEEEKELIQETEFQITLLNCKQLAIKVFMNTFYGETGNQKSPLFDVLISGGTTTLGQNYIRQVHKYIEERDCEIVYGDSILGNEPLLLKDQNNKIHIKTIESLMENKEIKQYGIDKEQVQCQYRVWTNGKWLKIKRVIRHMTNKSIYRVQTKDSIVEVTEDHSLINSKFEQIKPENCINQQILCSYPSECVREFKPIKQIFKQKLQLKGFLLDHLKSIPLDIINGDIQVISAFISGCIINNKYKQNIQTLLHNKFKSVQIKCKTKLITQQIYYLITCLNYHPVIEINDNKEHKYMITIYKNHIEQLNYVQQVTKMQFKENDNQSQYVYDLETEDGIFGAGIGRMTLKNTDSVYFRPRFSHFELYKKKKLISSQQTSIQNALKEEPICSLSSDMLESAYQATETLKIEINKMIGEQTGNFLRMAFEELLFPSMFTGKKKYCGVVYVPGKMDIKSTLTMKDILLRGIDFIKSQYPEIIKQVGSETLISIMEHFIQEINKNNDDQLFDMFQDTYRDNINGQLKQLIQQKIESLHNRLSCIKSDEYHLLSAKRKLRSTKTGQMMLFRQRLIDIQDTIQNFIYSSTKDYVLQINIQELQNYGISVPEDGEILDLISVKPPTNMNKLKASELIYLTQHAQKRGLSINIEEYLKMFRTTASRILVSAFFDNSIDDPDLQEKQALKDAKTFCDNCVKNTQIYNSITIKQDTLNQIFILITEFSDNFKQIVQKCINTISKRNYNILTKFPQYNNIDKIEQQIILYSDLLYILIQPDIIIGKLEFTQEQMPVEQLSDIIEYIKGLFTQYNDYRMIPLVIQLILMIISDIVKTNNIENISPFGINISIEVLDVYVFIKRFIQSQKWKLQKTKLLDYIKKTNKLPAEMTSEFNWLFKQRSVYIDMLKNNESAISLRETSFSHSFVQGNHQGSVSQTCLAQQDVTRRDLRYSRRPIDQSLPISGFPQLQQIIEEQLLNEQLIRDFFEESIWDFNYQVFKKTKNVSQQWVKQQINIYKENKLSQVRLLKLLKIVPDLVI